MAEIDKSLVKKQFNKGIKSYDNEASVQKQLAEKLINELRPHINTPLSRIFEVGSGTGFLTKQILEYLEFDQLITNDIAPNSKQKIKALETDTKKSIEFIEGDIENILLPKQLDLLISGATFQWLNDINDFINKVNQSLNANGILAFSTFGSDNFKEVKQITGVGLDYLSLNELVDLLSDKFNILFSDSWKEAKTFNTPIDVLRHIKKTGVNGIKKKPFNKNKIKKFISDYSVHFSTKKHNVTLTYNPIVVIAQKK